MIHLATHGYVDPRCPEAGGILLAPAAPPAPEKTAADGALQVWEVVAELHLRAELVVLSACETALGGPRAREGLVGLTWAFQAAGARSVVASQWQVDDRSTAALMAAFYRELARPGVAKDEALRRAMRAVASGKLEARWRSPTTGRPSCSPATPVSRVPAVNGAATEAIPGVADTQECSRRAANGGATGPRPASGEAGGGEEGPMSEQPEPGRLATLVTAHAVLNTVAHILAVSTDLPDARLQVGRLMELVREKAREEQVPAVMLREAGRESLLDLL